LDLDNIQTNKMDELFGDVGDEYKSLGAVKSFFEAWKTEFYEDYKNAFGSLSLPAAFEFYVRCELVAWDPFSVSEPLTSEKILNERSLTPFFIFIFIFYFFIGSNRIRFHELARDFIFVRHSGWIGRARRR
jgi:hypothetical protein